MENTVIAKNEFIRVLRYYGQKNGKVILEFIRSTTETEFFLFNFLITLVYQESLIFSMDYRNV